MSAWDDLRELLVEYFCRFAWFCLLVAAVAVSILLVVLVVHWSWRHT